MVHQTAPQYLQTLVPPSVHQVSQRTLRSQNNIHIPRSRTNLYRDSFIPKTSKDWNSLIPENMRHTQSSNEFWKLLDRDKILIPNYYNFGNRKSQIMHVRLRLHCSSLRSDLYRNHLADSDICIDCNSPETAKHYLLHCNKYTNIRVQSVSTIDVAVNIDIFNIKRMSYVWWHHQQEHLQGSPGIHKAHQTIWLGQSSPPPFPHPVISHFTQFPIMFSTSSLCPTTLLQAYLRI